VNSELIGYVASVLVALSLMMSSILRLRLINMVGAMVFAVYGLLIGSMPVAAVNTFIVGINVYYLWRIFGAREYFRVLRVTPDSEYLLHFLACEREDILRFEPGGVTQPEPHHVIFFVLRGVIPAGLVIGETSTDGTFIVHLDYVLPGYRDFRVGDYLYRRGDVFRQLGTRRILARADNRTHAKYLERMGFTPAPGAAGRYVRAV
jgi:hypothetical protein